MKRLILHFFRLTPNSVINFAVKQRRVLVLMINLGTILYSLIIALAIRFEFSIPPIYIKNFFKIAAVFILSKMILNYFFKLNRGLWRYFSLIDIKNVFQANLFSSSILVLIFGTWGEYICKDFPISVIIIDFLVCFCAM